jgi:2-phospho-L-lactate guanylyltransferase (CobY/MobA/RfbA family)
MISLTDKERRELLGELLMDELRVIREYLSDIPHIKQDIEELKQSANKHTQTLQENSYELSLALRCLKHHDELIERHDRDIKWIKPRLAQSNS